MVDLFQSQPQGGTVSLKNRIVMAPMTRTRTTEGALPTDGDLPNEMMATYYGQRASAGLIISEATYIPHPSAHSYENVPRFYTDASLQGWKDSSDCIRDRAGRECAQQPLV